MQQNKRKNRFSKKVHYGWMISLLFWVVFANDLSAATSSVDSATSSSTTTTKTTDSKTAEEKADKIDNLQEKIDKLENQIDQKRKKERTISGEIEIIDGNVETTKLQLQKTQKLVSDFDVEIGQKEKRVNLMERDILNKKEMMAEYLRDYDQNNGELALAMLEEGARMDDYFTFLDSMEKMQEQLASALKDIQSAKEKLMGEKEQLQDQRSEQYQISLMQEDQKKTLEYEQSRKERLLNQTQKDISLMSVEKEELRKQLNALQSLGTSISLDDAISAAKYASSKTGVRTEFLLGVLRVESNMGQNVGGGRYKTDMNPAQHDTFKSICKELGLKPEDMPVSKRVCYNKKAADGCGGWGGAMGPGQFMPTTWMGYKERVAKITGSDPNPWTLRDALVAMGLKLAAVEGVTAGKEAAERKAASMYLAGGNWANYTWYGDRVLYYADGFERYMKE